MRAETLPIDSIRIDGGTQLRIAMQGEAVDDYAAAMRDGATFPPITVYYDGAAYWLADGFHRLAAYRIIGTAEVLADVYDGTQRDAVLHAARANTEHGLRASRADRRNAVAVLLADDEWRQWSDRELGRIVGVDGKTVATVRQQLGYEAQGPRKMMRGGQELTIETAAIGKRAPTAEIPQSLEPTDKDRKAAERLAESLGVALSDAMAWAMVQRRKREAAALARAEREQAQQHQRRKAERLAVKQIAALPQARRDAIRKGFDTAKDIAQATGLRLADVLAVIQTTDSKGK